MHYLFGPVQSRRLGRSLGIDLFNGKICTLNCIYCELGIAAAPVRRRGAYSPVAEVLAEIDSFCADAEQVARIDVVTVTAKGEPTLHSGLEEILTHLKERCAKPVAVLTNGTTLDDPEVCRALMAADIIMPSLDSARLESFAAVDRPAPGLDLAGVVDSLTRFTHACTAQVWLEILLVRGVNDSDADLDALIAALRPMRLDRIQLNTVIRPPVEAWAEAVPEERLAVMGERLGRELLVPVDLPFATSGHEESKSAVAAGGAAKAALSEAMRAAIGEMLKRRPCTAADIDRTFHLGGPEKVEQLLEPLVIAGSLQSREHRGSRYYSQSSQICGARSDGQSPAPGWREGVRDAFNDYPNRKTMSENEKDEKEEIVQPVRKTRTGAWWKSVIRGSEKKEEQGPEVPVPLATGPEPPVVPPPEPPMVTEAIVPALIDEAPAMQNEPLIPAAEHGAAELDAVAESEAAPEGEGEAEAPAPRKRRSRRGGKKRGKKAEVAAPVMEEAKEEAREDARDGDEEEEPDQADEDRVEDDIPETPGKAVTYKLLINAEEPEECRIALVEDGQLESFHVTTIDREPTKNNIYKGRIVSVEANLQAAFVDIGTGRNGFLPFNEIHPEYYRQDVNERCRALIAQQQWKKLKIEEVMQKGQEVLVQVVKEVTGNKGANMTTYLSLPGRCLVLMPGSDSSGISRKIVGEERRAGLREIMSEFEIPEGIGYIIRTASAEITRAALEQDLKSLLTLWEEIKRRGQTNEAPALVYEEQDTVIRFLRDHFFAEIQEIMVDTEESMAQVNAFIDLLPAKQKKVKVRLHRGAKPIFNQYNVEEQIESIFKPQVTLPSGGSIVINPTEALVAIDVNSGRTSKNSDFEETIFLANMEAAAELARQLRLRDLGGLIVVDFIDMRNKKHIREVERQVKTSMKRDKAKTDISKISRFGLMQISRQKMGAPIEKGSYRTCEFCQGRGVVRSVETLALYYLRRIQTGISRKKVARVECRLPLDVAQYLLNKKRVELCELESRHQARIDIIPRVEFKPSDNQIEFQEGEGGR